MPASRWHSNPAELFDWIDENDAELLDMFLPSIFARFNQKKDEPENTEHQSITPDVTETAPEIVPILPLMNLTPFFYNQVEYLIC